MKQTMKYLLAVWIHAVMVGFCHGVTTPAANSSATTESLTSANTTLVTDPTVNVTDVTELTSIYSQETTAVITSEATTTALHTTPLHTTTTSRPVTHSPDNKPPIGTWTVKDKNDNVCMKMQMGVRFTIPFTNTSQQTDIAVIDAPLSSHPVGNCDGSDREFKLHLFNDGTFDFFYVSLSFESSSKYKMTEVSTFYTFDQRLFVNASGFGTSWKSSGSDNYLNNSIPLKNSFSCGHNLPFPLVLVTLYDVKFMPFADETQGEFGESALCKNAEITGSWPAILVLVAIVVVIAAVVVGAVFGYKKYKKSRTDDMRQPIIQNA